MNDRFLTLAVEARLIDTATRQLALQYVNDCRTRQETPAKVGTWLVEQRYIVETQRDEILRTQVERRGASPRDLVPRFRRLSDAGIELLLAIAAIVSVGVLVELYQWPLHVAVEVSGFFAFVVTAAVIKYLRHGSIPLALLSAAKWAFVTLVAATLIFGSVSALTIQRILNEAQVPTAEARQTLAVSLARVQAALIGLTGASVLLAVYGLWKFQALRYSESRLGALKDLLSGIESTLRNNAVTDTVRREAIDRALKTLRSALALAPGQSLTRVGRLALGPSYGQTFVFLETADDGQGRFNIAAWACPPDAPQQVNAACEWLQTNFHPTFLRSEDFERLKEMARGNKPGGWRGRYLNFPVDTRSRAISLCGWIYAKGVTLFSPKAAQCLALDRSIIVALNQGGFGDVAKWFEVESVVGCPVGAHDGTFSGVLLALNTRVGGIRPQDAELLLAVSRIIGLINGFGGGK